MAAKMNPVKAIKTYMEQDGGPKVSMDEFKALSSDERRELGQLCADALGVELDTSLMGAVSKSKAAA